jgi:hypothetical protein
MLKQIAGFSYVANVAQLRTIFSIVIVIAVLIVMISLTAIFFRNREIKKHVHKP